jgi:hypothetical protein
MKKYYDWKVIKKRLQKTVPKKSPKNTPKKNFRINPLKVQRKKIHFYFLKKAYQKKFSKKVLKRKKNKPYIVTHWHASLNSRAT